MSESNRTPHDARATLDPLEDALVRLIRSADRVERERKMRDKHGKDEAA